MRRRSLESVPSDGMLFYLQMAGRMQYPFGEQPEKTSVLAGERPWPENILTPVGSITFTRTRFINKETGETAYLLDRILGWEPHTLISEGVKAGMLEVVAQGSYEKA